MMSGHASETIQIAGAGPAGLAAAITLAHTGKKVLVHEAQPDVGWRFKRDLQGLENWTTDRDVLHVLDDYGITTDCDYLPCTKVVSFDAWGQKYFINSKTPIFYLVERGPNPGSLDSALLKQAQQIGVEVRFNSRVKQLPFPSILATGPKAADAIAVGYHFDTDMSDGYWVICDDKLAPGGYAYLLIWNGKGTVKTCMFSDFRNEKQYVQRTVEAFQSLVGLEMKNPVPHGGAGNFSIPICAYAGQRPVIGEQAGFQDTLWGFGMRHAIISGVLAARSIMESRDFDAMWYAEFKEMLKISVVNRALYSLIGNRGYRWLLTNISRQKDVRQLLFAQYHRSMIKTLIYPWAKHRIKSLRKDLACKHVDCECVWCRCGGEP